MSTSVLSLTQIESQTAKQIQRWLTHGTVLLSDLISFTLAGALAVFVRYLFHAKYTPHDYLGFAPAILIFLLVFANCGLYPGVGSSPIEESRLILRASSIGFLLLIGASFFLREGLLASRIVFALAWALTIVLVPLFRRILRGALASRPWWGIPTVILGEREAGTNMLDLLQGHRRVGLRPIAFLSDDFGREGMPFAPDGVLIASLSQASRLAQENAGCYAVVVMPNASSERLQAVYNEHIQTYQNVLIVPDLFGMRSIAVSTSDICGVLTLKLDQRRARALPRLIKRAFDLVITGAVSVLLMPLFLMICTLVKLSSDGPVFYGQPRIGKHGRLFSVWKFRSMVTDADAILKHHCDSDPALREEWERDHKLKVDPRVTRVGSFLRKTSLDELPQLWNILSGDMSLVGPRPIVESEVSKYGIHFEQYRKVTPGLTGLWQISGRNNTTYDLRIRMDGYYVLNWSLSLDIYILLRTLKTVVLSEGAY